MMQRHFRRAVLYPWWRLTRGLTLGVRGIVADGAGRVLLVRHSYVPGWHLPGGGVERGEAAGDALARELREEAGVELVCAPRLHGLYCNGASFPGDHVAVFLIDGWRRPEPLPVPNAEILEAAFFPLAVLPEGTSAGTRRRLDEAFAGAPVAARW